MAGRRGGHPRQTQRQEGVRRHHDRRDRPRGLAGHPQTPTPADPQRSELAVKLRGASYGDREAVLATARDALADHEIRLAHYQHLAERDYPGTDTLTGPLTGPLTDQDLDTYLVLRGGIRLEEFWTGWLGEYLDAHETCRAHRPAPPEDR